VSLSWREQVFVALCPDRIVLLHLDRGGRRARLGKIVPCPPAAAREALWAPALAALRAILPEYTHSRAEVSLVLSNHFMRYQLLPWSDRIGGEAEEQAYGRYGFSQVHGEAAARWAIRLSGDGGDQPWLASAVDAALVAELERAVAEAGLRLRSIQPHLMAAFNRWRGQLRGDAVWFALAEPGRLCLALLRGGRWSDLGSFPVATDVLAELPDLLARQRLLADLAGQADRVYVWDPAVAAPAAGKDRLQWLRPRPIPGLPAGQSAPFQMAWPG
jgi:hypothetical protein